MEIAASELARILELYSQGLYLQAYNHAVSLAPIKEWEGTAARLLAGRLTRQLGAPRLSRWLMLKAYRGQPTHPEAIYYHARYFLEKYSLLESWNFLRRERDVILDASPELRADLFSLHGFIAARLRDFEQGERWVKQALDLAPTRPWIRVEQAACLEFEERLEEALAIANQAMEMRPYFRPAVQAAGHLLLLLDRDNEALELLKAAAERIECAAILSQLAALQDDLGMHADAQRSYQRFEELSPIMETEVQQWLAARRSDIAYDLGDREAARNFATAAGEGFHQTVSEKLANIPEGAKRTILPNVERLPRPLPQYVPAALAILRRAWKPDQPLPSDELFRQDSPSEYLERRWAEQEDWIVREFTATNPSLTALIDAGIPVALNMVEATYSQLQAIAGYDQLKGIVLFRDPSERHLGEMMLDPLLERFRSLGPRALIMLPPDQAGRLQGIDLPDAELYDRVYQLHVAMEKQERNRALQLLAELEAAAPEHRLALYARYVLARYDGHNSEQLAALDKLLERFPDDATFQLWRVGCLRELDRKEERMALLRQMSKQPNADPIFAQQLAQELLPDAREHRTVERMLHKVMQQRPLTAYPYYFLANVLWDQQRQEEALPLYRFAACLDDQSDPLSRTYFRSARAINLTEEALQFFHDRVRRFGDKSSQPARVLFNVLSDLDQMDEAFAVLDRALARRKTDGDLLLFAAEMRASFGETKTAASLLKAARDKTRPTAWLRAAANLAGLQGNLTEALGYWRQVTEAEPLAMDAHRNIAMRVAEVESRAAALDYLQKLTEHNPRHYGMLQLRIEWLRSEGPAAVEPVVRQLIEAHPADAWAHRELALHLADQKRYDEAEAELESAARLEPPSPSYHCVRGRVETLAGKNEKARESYRAAIRLNVDNELAISELMSLCRDRPDRQDELHFVEEELAKQPHYGDGVLAFFNHAMHTLEPEQTHSALQDMLDHRPDLWQTWSAMVQQLLMMERFDEARTLAEQATERFPMLPRLWLDRADACAARNDNDGQIEMLRQALKISPGWGPATRELAEALERGNQLEEASTLLQQAVARAPLDAANRGQYADKLWKLGQSEAAVEQLQEALRLDPGYDWAWRTLNDWCERMDQPEKVLEFSRDLTVRRPGDTRTWLALVRNLNNPVHVEEVLAALDRVLALNPRNSEARDLKAERLTEQGRYDEAVEACQIVPGEDVVPLILQGRGAWVEARRGQLDVAIEQMEKITTDEPDYYWGWQQLADWYNEVANAEKYLEAANHLVRLRPDSPVALARRGEALLQTGERESGKSDLRAAQQLAPDYPFAGMLLFDEYMADEEYGPAAATLAILQEHIGDDFVISRQAQLAARQEDKTTALDAFRNLCESPIEATWPISSALGAIRGAGWSSEADEVLKESIQSRVFHPHAALLWLDGPGAEAVPPEERLEALERLIERHPRYLPGYDRKAEQLARMERYEEAMSTCRPKVFEDQTPPLILRGRAAWVEFERGRREQAVTQMEAIVEESPDYFWGWQQLANWNDRMERYEKYLEAADAMVRLAPRDATAFGYRGEAKLRNGDREGAKEDFRLAFEMDPDYGFAGLHLLDQQIEDDELDDAGDTLAMLQQRGDDAYIRLRALRLAIRRSDRAEAVRLLEAFTIDEEAPLHLLQKSIELMDEGEFSDVVNDVFGDAIDDEAAAALVGKLWIERQLDQKNYDCVEKIEELLERGPIGQEALVAYLETLARKRDSERLLPFIDRYREALRADTSKWGKTGWALTRIDAYTRAVEWMGDWSDRNDAGSWMLINLAISYRALNREPEAAHVSQFALKNAEPDYTTVFHSVWLAFDDAVAGNTQQAAHRAAQVEKDRDKLDAYFRLVHVMVQSMVKIQERGRGAFSEASAALEKAARDNADLDPDPAIYNSWRKCASRMARDAIGIKSWMWKRRVNKNPPLPPLNPPTSE
jgi:tetratricopeptide (TPR) repeat protein